MSAARIAAQNSRMAAAASHFVSGDRVLGDLVNKLGGNYTGTLAGLPGVTVPGGDAGIPTLGDGGAFYNPSWLPARPASAAAATGGTPGGAPGGSCVYPEVLPLQTLFPIPAAGLAGLPLTGDGSGIVWGGIGLLAFALWAIKDMGRRGKR
jgi:hypothetical protein